MSRMDDDLLLTPALRRRFYLEADGGSWCAFMTRSNGELHRVASSAHQPPPPEQVMFAGDMAGALNRQLHHDGRWVVLLMAPESLPEITISGIHSLYRKWAFLWVDAEGDVAFAVENDEPLWRVLEMGPDHWVEQAEQAWRHWRHLMRDVLDPRPDQLYRRAQGERAPSMNGRRVH